MAKAWKAGWYPYRSTGIPGQLRYWDGTAWTGHWANPSLDAARRGEMAKRGVAAPAAWHPDPTEDNPGRLRWWDGRVWTQNVHNPAGSPSPATKAPEPASTPAAPPPAAPPTPPPSPPTPAARVVAPKPVRKPMSKRSKIITATSLVTVAVLAFSAIGYVVYEKLNQLPICSEAGNDFTLDVPIELMTTAKPVCTDPVAGLDYTAPVSGLTDGEVTFEFPTALSHDDVVAEKGVPKEEAGRWGFQVFADPALTVELPFYVGDSEDGSGWEIASLEEAWYQAAFGEPYQKELGLDECCVDIQLRDHYYYFEGADGEKVPTAGQWGLRDVYYLVRYVDAKGHELERPVVSEFRFEHKLATPRMSVGTDPASPGTLTFAWDAVPGADTYVIVVGSTDLSNGEAQNWRNYAVVGGTTETTWTADSAFRAETNWSWRENYRAYQNYTLELFQFREDYDQNPDDYGGWDVGDWEYGVVAIGSDSEGKKIASALGAVDALDVAASSAFAFSEYTFLDRWGGQIAFGTEFATFDDIPTSVPIITLDGKIVDAPAVLVGATLLRADDAVRPGVVQIGLFAAGTQLGVPVFVEIPDGEDALDLIDEYNERALYDSPLQGAAEATMGHYVLSEATLLDAAPRTDYPVHQGTHPFVTFLGNHMVARTEAIDVARWLNQPGLPDVWDAVYEAIRQNPYAYVLDASASGTVIYVRYAYGDGDYQQHQAELKSAVEQAVASIITPGSSARDKAKAINSYLVNNVEYDYGAWEVMGGYNGADWWEHARDMGQLHAWEANGVFKEHTVVCAGYAIAFAALGMEAGLPVEFVQGVVTYNGGLHAWTKVQVDGTWYAVDSTWNDSPQGNKYLLIKDSQFTGYSKRSQDSVWVLDSNAGWFATP